MGVARKIPTFFRWLTFQQHRKDSVGYFAKVIIKSKKEIPIKSSYLEWYLLSKDIGSQSLIEDFNDAWEEYNNHLNQ